MRKLILLLTLLAADALGGRAQVSLRVIHVSCDESVFHLDKQPEVSFLGGTLTIGCPNEEAVAFELDDVASIDFLGKSGVGSAGAVAGGISVTVSGGLVTFDGIPAGSLVELYNIAGALVSSTKSEGSHTIGRSELPGGVYIVKINNFVTKISL